MLRASSRARVGAGLEHAAPVLGAALLWVGRDGHPALVWAGAAVLLLAGLRLFGAASGYALLRPGRLRILPLGCWDVPLSFAVRHDGQVFLFHRRFDPTTGTLPDEYTVYALPRGQDAGGLRFLGVDPPSGSRRIGHVSTSALRFEHYGGSFVRSAALARCIGPPRPGSTGRSLAALGASDCGRRGAGW